MLAGRNLKVQGKIMDTFFFTLLEVPYKMILFSRERCYITNINIYFSENDYNSSMKRAKLNKRRFVCIIQILTHEFGFTKTI